MNTELLNQITEGDCLELISHVADASVESIITDPPYFLGVTHNGEKVHPTQKPIELFEKLITDSTREGDTVLDCFGGSGTLAVAAKRTGRNFIVFELQEKYCKIANQRLENL